MKINRKILKKIKKEIRKFKKLTKKENLFKEMSFCILVANNNLEKTYKIWKSIKDNLISYNYKSLSRILKKSGYRFYNTRAKYIIENKNKINDVLRVLNSQNENYVRNWLVKNIKGFGYKEASHFLRNIGYRNFAILDRHILRFLFDKKIIKEIPKNLTKKKYVEIENKLKQIAKKNNLTLAELDMYIFYLQTNKIPIK